MRMRLRWQESWGSGMTPERLREIARDCEDASVVSSKGNANELRRLADHLDTCLQHSCWVWNRGIIEKIRAVVPNAPVLDEDLADVICKRFDCTDCPPKDYPTDKTRCEECPKRKADLPERANDCSEAR